jgi:hypothetical protein
MGEHEKLLPTKNKRMKTLYLDDLKFQLPDDMHQVRSILNHIDMVRNGRKQFVKLVDMNGKEHIFMASFLNNVEIKVRKENFFKKMLKKFCGKKK